MHFNWNYGRLAIFWFFNVREWLWKKRPFYPFMIEKAYENWHKYYGYYGKKHSHKNSVLWLAYCGYLYIFNYLATLVFHWGMIPLRRSIPFHNSIGIPFNRTGIYCLFLLFWLPFSSLHCYSLMFALKENFCHNWRNYNMHLECKNQ